MSKFKKATMNVKSVSIIALLLVLVLLPFVGLSSYVLYTVGALAIYSVIALGLNILIGYSGQMSIGHAGFVAIGAYMSSFLINNNVTPIIALIISGILAGFIGLLMGLPAIRLEGHNLAIVTLVFAIAVGKLITIFDSFTGGFSGLRVNIPHPFGFALPQSIERYLFIILVCVILIWSATKFLQTRTGRAFNAVRSGEIAAAAMGINPARTRIIAFVISSIYAGVAGGLIAINSGFISVADFSLFTSLTYLGMVVVGGQGSVLGSILGALLFGLAPELLANFQALATACLGVIIIIIMKLSPKGLAPLLIEKFGRNSSKALKRREYLNEQKEMPQSK